MLEASAKQGVVPVLPCVAATTAPRVSVAAYEELRDLLLVIKPNMSEDWVFS